MPLNGNMPTALNMNGAGAATASAAA